MKGELRKNDVLTESLQEAAKSRNRPEWGSGGGQRRGSGEAAKRWWYGLRVQKYFYGFVWAVQNRLLE